MILTIGNTKGGVGKTTLSVQLAIARALSGRDVWLIDGDRQGTAMSSISMRMQSEKQPGISCVQYSDGPTLRAQVQQQRAKFDDIIIDVGGRDSTALRAALMLTDILIVPFAPRTYDVWALDDMSNLVEEARSIRDDLKAYTVLNLADANANSADNSDAAAAVAEFVQFEYLDAPVRRRKAFSDAAGVGFSVHEMAKKDIKACAEIDALYNFVFSSK